ncbi:MAG TPA: 6-carboxytetrahydropterin synthase [Bacteroidia bacterium]|nr:6-carboxytetrahydropterin synthase [Bacteroidia bacterium]
MVFITRRERFNAAHKLYKEEWSAEKNMEVFGKCSNPNWHGHNYELYITVKGEPDAVTGFVIDLKELGDIVKAKVINKLDHKNINLDVDFMKGQIPTTEVLAVAIWNQIEKPIEEKKCKMHSVRLVETENNFVEYFGK